jgi:hypothetical protein
MKKFAISALIAATLSAPVGTVWAAESASLGSRKVVMECADGTRAEILYSVEGKKPTEINSYTEYLWCRKVTAKSSLLSRILVEFLEAPVWIR